MSTGPDLTTAAWRKSSYSNGDGGACLEVADHFTAIVPVRDSKNQDGSALTFSRATWTSFVTAVRNDSTFTS